MTGPAQAHNNLDYPAEVIPALRYQYCPLCAASLVRAVLFDDNLPRVTCPACGWIQLVGNTVGVVVVAHNEAGVVAILPPGEQGAGLPAGLVEYGEDPEEAAVREALEETGLEVEILGLLGWFFSPNQHWPGPLIQFMYEARITGGALQGSAEGPAKIFPLDQFPAIAPNRLGSLRAMQTYLAKIDG